MQKFFILLLFALFPAFAFAEEFPAPFSQSLPKEERLKPRSVDPGTVACKEDFLLSSIMEMIEAGDHEAAKKETESFKKVGMCMILPDDAEVYVEARPAMYKGMLRVRLRGDNATLYIMDTAVDLPAQ